MKHLKEINWKRGSGSTYLGVVIMLIAFSWVLININLNQLFFVSVKTQTVIDTVIDGASVAGNTDTGFDETVMQNVAQELVERNSIPGVSINYSINAEDEVDLNGNPTGNKLVIGSITAEGAYYTPEYLGLNDRFVISQTAVVQVNIQTNTNGWIQQSYFNNPTAIVPFYTTQPGARNPAYVTWFINNHLNPELNPIYQYSIANSHGHEFLFDYLKCMGVDDGTPKSLWTWRYFYLDWPQYTSQGWTTYSGTDANTVQQAADAGKAVVITCTTDDNDIEIYVVVPHNNALQKDCVATATVGKTNWNYKELNLAELINESSSVHISIHE